MKFYIHESKNSDKVVKSLTFEQLKNYFSKKYAAQILAAHENGSLWGLHFTKTGKIRATFI